MSYYLFFTPVLSFRPCSWNTSWMSSFSDTSISSLEATNELREHIQKLLCWGLQKQGSSNRFFQQLSSFTFCLCSCKLDEFSCYEWKLFNGKQQNYIRRHQTSLFVLPSYLSFTILSLLLQGMEVSALHRMHCCFVQQLCDSFCHFSSQGL